MNTFALATLTLSTLCLGGAFAAIVTARHVRLRRDTEDRRALGHVLEEVDRRLAALAAAEESGATAQIVGRLVRLDERIGRLAGGVAPSAESAAGAPAGQAPTIEELLGDASEDVEVAAPAASSAPSTNDSDDTRDDADDPELAALLAKFEDESSAGAARSKGKGAARPGVATAPAPVASAEELDRAEPDLDTAASLAAAQETEARSAIVEDEREATDASLDESLASGEPDDHTDHEDAGDALDELLDPEAFADDEPSDNVHAEEVVAEMVAGVEITEGVVAQCRPTTADDDLALDELVLFFHEDDQGEVFEASADDVVLFDEVPPSFTPPALPSARARTGPMTLAEMFAGPASRETHRATTLRASIDELTSLTERLSRPKQDRSERLRLVSELSAVLARVRR